MRTKSTLLALSTAIVLLGATAAMANDSASNTGEVGGAKIGPLGQVFTSGQVQNGWNSFGYNSYGYAAPSHHKTARPASK